MFKKKNKEEKKSPTLFDKLVETHQNALDKLDFNTDYMNQYLIKAITGYVSSKYKQDTNLCKDYVSKNLLNQIDRVIEKDKQLFKFSNEQIQIGSARLTDQKIETINYVSEIVIRIEVNASYTRENIFTRTVRKIQEVYTEDLVLSFDEDVWKIKEIRNQNFKEMNDDEIIIKEE